MPSFAFEKCTLSREAAETARKKKEKKPYIT